MDKKYWENYYKAHPSPGSSLCARYVFENHIKDGDRLIELGSGNGRDSIFFAQNNIQTIAVDQCEEEIMSLREKYNIPTLSFESADFTKLNDMSPFDHIYSRFTLHSIKENEENSVINWAYRNLKEGGKFLIEARSKNNELYGLGESVPGEPDAYVYNSHYRRFIDTDKLREKLEKAGFEIFLFEEENGFGGETDQCFFRKIAIKK